MLVLTRKAGEKIRIGEGLDAIEITVVGVRGNRARIGVDAPGILRISRPQGASTHDQ